MRTIFRAAITAAFLFALWPVAAFAQALIADPIVITGPTFAQELLAVILPALGLIATAVVTFAANELRTRTGIDIGARHRGALRSSLLNGVIYALQKAGWVQGQPYGQVASARAQLCAGLGPDAIASFGIDTANSLGQAALDRLLTSKLAVAAGTIMPNGDKLLGKAAAGVSN